jgi:pimeloyl-ACP methyl ester carboxylesterase
MKVSDQLELRFGFVITEKENGELSATMNVIEQKEFDIQMDIITFVNDSLYIELSAAGISYIGKYDFESKTIDGAYIQGRANLELNLHEVDELPRGEVIRPQTPVRPFPYIEEELVFENGFADVQLSGTLTLPQSESPSPAIILVAGSGHTDRNETPMGHFLLLADYLTRSGYVVLRYDKRGVGESTGNYDEATSYDFAKDLKAGVNLLKSRKEVDKRNIGIIGHSEGALLALMVASEMKDIAFIVLMGGIGVHCDQLLLTQTEKIARINGVPEVEINEMVNQYEKYYSILKTNYTEEEKREKIKESNPEISNGVLGMLFKPWFQAFIKINPDMYLENVQCPVLAITGENDAQCSAVENLNGIKIALEKGENNDYKVKSMPGLNHLFQTSKSGSPIEYENIAEIIAPAALELIGTWINSKINNDK